MKVDWEALFYWAMALFCLFLVYQTLRYIFGGSWALEGLMIAFLVANFSFIVTQSGKISHLEGEFREFKRSMSAMAKDFKEFRDEMREFRHATENRFIHLENRFIRLENIIKNSRS